MSARIDTFRQQKPGATGRDAARGSAKQRKPVTANSAARAEESAGMSVPFQLADVSTQLRSDHSSAMLSACDAASETRHARIHRLMQMKPRRRRSCAPSTWTRSSAAASA